MALLIIGDNCIDTFIYGKVERLAPEAPVPIIIPENTISTPGMAGNVWKNIKALPYKKDIDFIHNEEDIVKTRYVCTEHNYILLRVDHNDGCKPISINDLTKIDFDKYEAIIISDYNKGFLSEVDIEFIAKSHPCVFLDTKKILGDYVEEVKYIKINFHEFKENTLYFKNHPETLNKTIITRGKYGCNFRGINYPTQEVPVKDVSGAGDTFLAGLVVKYIETQNIEEAIKYAQECTTIVVQKVGVSTI